MRKFIRNILVLYILLFLVGVLVMGVTVRIVPTPFLYPTIQSAIDASSDSDVVLVIPAYTGAGEVFPITVNDKNIFIKGVQAEFDTTPSFGLIPVRGQAGRAVFRYINVSYGLLAGFTLQGGSTGILCENSSFIVAQNLITGNSGPKGAGVLVKRGSAPVITLCTIANNTADSAGGGIYIEPMSAAVVSGDTVRNNSAIIGGGIYVSSGLAELSGNVIVSNSAQKGGGVFFDVSAATFTNNRISSNSARIAGGGVYLTNGSNPVFGADTFYSNIAPKGGAIFVNAFEDTMISITPPPLFTIQNSVFNSDWARVSGGGIYVNMRVVSVIWNCFFSGTGADSVGGALYIERPESLFVMNSTFYRTKARVGGGGIFARQPSNCFFKNCVFHSDSAGTGGAMLLYFTGTPSTPPVIADNIFDNSNLPINSVVYSNLSRVVFEYNRVPGSGSVVGFPLSATNAVGDPRFAYTTPTDFRLRLDSPCIDTGEPDTLIYRDDDLGRCDMGVFGGPGAINPPRPRKVELLTLFTDSAGVRLTWSPVVYPAFISYAIYRSDHPGFLPVELNGASHRLDTTSSLTYFDPVIVGVGETYCYRVNAFIRDTLVAGGYSNEVCTTPLAINITNPSPDTYYLKIFPNPFNSALVIERSGQSDVEIYDAYGKLIANIKRNERIWKPGNDIPSGLYFVKLRVGKAVFVEKAVYMK